MPGLMEGKVERYTTPRLVTRVDDYAISGGWACNGDVVVTVDAAGSIFGIDGRSGATLWAKRDVHAGGVLAMAIHPDTKRVATSGQNGKILSWNARDGECVQSIEMGRGWVEHLAWSKDGQRLAASNSRGVHVYDLNGHELWKTDDHPSTVSALAWSESKELSTACYGQLPLRRSDRTTRPNSNGKAPGLDGSESDGDIVACGSRQLGALWRRSTSLDSMMSGYPGKPSALAFDSTGMLLATGGGEAITVWSFEGDGPEGTRPGVLELHPQPITTLRFSSGKKRLASGARDGSVVVWSLRNDGSGEPIGVARLDALVSELSWRPDGRGLIGLDADGGVTSWRVG